MNRFFSLLIGAIITIAMCSTAQAQNPYRGGTGYDGGWGSKRQAVEMYYRGYPVNYKTTFLPPAPRPCYSYPANYGGGGCAPGYYGGGSSFSFGVSYQSGGRGRSGVGFGVGYQSSSYGGNRATNVGVNLAYSSARGSHWGRR